MIDSLADTTVVVIGGSSGIGLATSRLAAADGARVVIAGRDHGRLDAAVADVGNGAAGVACDVADEEAVAALFDALDHVDHVVCLAGVHGGGPIVDTDVSALLPPVDSRFWGPVYLAKYAAPKMTGGSITLCTGVGVARPRPGNAIVTAACAGAEVFALAMALELAPIRVNVIRPGIVDTPLLDRMTGDARDDTIAALSKRIPLRRIAQPDEIAHAIAFLMTNPYVTGSTLTIDGGIGIV